MDMRDGRLVLFLAGGRGRGARLVGAGPRLAAVRCPEDFGGAVGLRAAVDLRLAVERLAAAAPLRDVDLDAAALRLGAAGVRALAGFAADFPADDLVVADFFSLLTVALCAADRFGVAGLGLRVADRFTAAALRAAGRFDAGALRAVDRLAAAGLRTAAGLRVEVRDALVRFAADAAGRLRAEVPVLARPAAFFATTRRAGFAGAAAARDFLDLAA